MRRLVIVLIGLLAAGCAIPDGTHGERAEFAWGSGGVFTPVPGEWTSRQHTFTGEGDLWLRIIPPPIPGPAAVRLEIRREMLGATRGGVPVYDASRRFPVFALPESSEPLLIHYRVHEQISITAPTFGPPGVLTEATIRVDLKAVFAIILIFVGLGTLVTVMLRRRARGYLWLALFAVSLGMLQIAQTSWLLIILVPSQSFWDGVRKVGPLLYVIAMVMLVEVLFVRPNRDRYLRGIAAAAACTLVVRALLALARIEEPFGRRVWVILTVLTCARSFWIVLPRARRGERRAQMYLIGVSLLFLCGLPDLLWTQGIQVLPFTTSHFGTLAFVSMLALTVDENFSGQRRELAARVRELEGRNAEVQDLNAELRRQVAQRSKELAQVLQDPSLHSGRLHLGDVVDDRYRIMRFLGEGGMGTVFEVERTTDGRRFALKVLAGSTSPVDAARFAREAEIAAQLDHPNLVRVLDVGFSRGSIYLVMELVEGVSLEDERAHFGDVPWALEILKDLAGGLAALHDRGVVHRDLKPGNVLLAPREGGGTLARISDFGISHVHSSVTLRDTVDPTERARLTATGAMMGTPFYMSPETAHGASGVGPPGDVFSFGVMAYEMLAGRPPFTMPPVFEEAAHRPLTMPPTLASLGLALPPEITRTLDTCILQEPAKRPSAAELAATLAR